MLSASGSSGWRPVKAKAEGGKGTRWRRLDRRLLTFLLLLAAIFAYLNWKGAEFNREAAVRREVKPADAVLVDAPQAGKGTDGEAPRDFLTATRLERERARSERVQLLKDIIRSQESSPQAKSSAQQQILDLNARSGKEAEVETLLKAKGFPRSVALINDKSATVIVMARRLDPKDVARIADVTAAVTGLPFESVRIIPYDR